MKRVLLTLALASSLFAEDAPKENDGYIISFTPSLNASVNLFTKNWESGQLGSANWNINVDFTAEKQLNEKLFNSNYIKLNYGQTAVQEKVDGKKDWSDFEESQDKIEAEALLKFTLGKMVDPYVSLYGSSVFSDDRENHDKRRINPVTLKESFGAARLIVDEERTRLDARLGGAARQLVDKNFENKGETETTNDMGLELVFAFKTANEKKSVDYTSQFELYEALYRNGQDELTDDEVSDIRTPDIKWTNTVKLNVAKVLIFNFGMDLLYDVEIDEDARLSNNLSAGLSYTFTNKK